MNKKLLILLKRLFLKISTKIAGLKFGTKLSLTAMTGLIGWNQYDCPENFKLK